MPAAARSRRPLSPPREPPTAAAPGAVPGWTITEDELAAAALGLLARPAQWDSLDLPPPLLSRAQAQPWSTYWATRLDAGLAVPQARPLLAAALAGFRERDDLTGQCLALAAIIEGYYIDEGPLDGLDAWVAALAAVLPGEGLWPSAELEARVMACGVGILLRSPGHALLAAWAERGPTLLRQLPPGAARLKLATFLAQYHLWRGEFSRTTLIIESMPGLSDLSGLLPAEALVWLETVANQARMAGEPQRGMPAIDAALRLARRHGLREHQYALHAHGAALALAAQDLAATQGHLAAMRPVLDGQAQPDQTHYWHFLAGAHLLAGDLGQALELARLAWDNSREIGGPYRSALHALSLGQILMRAQRHEEACEWLARSLELSQGIAARLVMFSARLMLAWALNRLGQAERGREQLAQALADGALHDFRITAGWWLEPEVAELAAWALREQLQPVLMTRWVRLHHLPCRDPGLAAWPWRLRLHGFGEFEAWADEQPLVRRAGKTAQRPLDLLRALLAHGPGPLPVVTVLDWLWPEQSPSAQRKAFDVALLRLRRLLGDATLVQLEGGKLVLDEHRCHTDVAALHDLMQRIGSAHGASLAELQQWSQRLLDLMRGPFLAGDDSDWVQAARQRYRQRFVITVAQLAAHLETQDAAASIRLYERALDIEPLAESLSRRLMQLHARRGDQAEALRAWRSCCTLLRLSAGLGPSQETRELARSLGLAP